jgi:hypothetical protein
MGIGRVEARAALAAIKAGTNRAHLRGQVADCIDLLNHWLAARDAQDASALAGFADDKPAQFNSFVAALPDPPVDQTP